MRGNKLVHPFGLELQTTTFAVLEVANLAACNDLTDAADSAAKLLCYFFDFQHRYLNFYLTASCS